jgi:hypothetical protein
MADKATDVFGAGSYIPAPQEEPGAAETHLAELRAFDGELGRAPIPPQERLRSGKMTPQEMDAVRAPYDHDDRPHAQDLGWLRAVLARRVGHCATPSEFFERFELLVRSDEEFRHLAVEYNRQLSFLAGRGM